MRTPFLRQPYAFDAAEISVATLSAKMQHLSEPTLSRIEDWHTSIANKVDQFAKSNQLFEDAFKAALTHSASMIDDIRKVVFEDLVKEMVVNKANDIEYIKRTRDSKEYEWHWKRWTDAVWPSATWITDNLPKIWKDYFRLRFLEQQTL